MSNNVIAAAIKERLVELQMGADEVLVRLTQQARGTIEDFGTVEKYGSFVLDLSKAAQAGKLGNIKKFKPTKYGYEIELYDAQAALALLGKAHRLFVERVEVDDTGLTDDDRATRIAALLDRAGERRARLSAGNDAAALGSSAGASDDGGDQ